MGVHQEFLDDAEEIANRVESSRTEDNHASRKLRGLLVENDAGNLADKLQLVRERCEGMGDDALRVIGEIRDRVGRLALQEQHQEWLGLELKLASERQDTMRLRQ